MLKVIELFAGIGAQHQALKNIGIDHEVIAISEIDKYALKAYELLHGEVNNLGDISKIERLPQSDLWTYSFPCTDISICGRMNGFDKDSGTKSSLLWEVQRLLTIAKQEGTLPKVLLLENVKNLVSRKFIELFKVWCEFLTSLGYSNYYKVLNAKNYEIPQNRERVFMISVLDSEAEFEFPEAKVLNTKLRDYLETNVDDKYYLSVKLISYMSDMKNRNGFIRGLQFKPRTIDDEIAWTITTKTGSRPSDNYIVEPVIVTNDNKVIVPQATKNGYAIAEVGDGIYVNRCASKRGVVQKDMIPTIKSSCHDIGVVVIKNNQETRIKTDNIAIRRLTPRECWRLMGFKDEQIDKVMLTKEISDTQLYKMAGNSIVVDCLESIFQKLLEVI